MSSAGGGWTEKKEEKFPLCESIGHWPLWGRCPKRGTLGMRNALENFGSYAS